MSKFKYIILTFSLFLVACIPLKAQLVIQDILTDVELVQQVLLGDGVQVYNISSTASPGSIGEFDTGIGDPSVPMSSGIIMSTGDIFDAPGPNLAGGTSSNNGTAGDTDIEAIIGINTNDAAVIEFDFKSPADTVMFNYIFASEEYREYVCNFNDAFAFLLTGPNPLGGTYTDYNIALVPGTSTEVAIATVNNGDSNSTCPEENSNSGYYVDNTGGIFVEYDGLTQMFTAMAIVEPCEEYHIKLVIADALDSAYDSAVFLEANSFGADVDTLVPEFVYTQPGCTEEDIDFVNAGPSGYGVTYEWTFYGSASIASSTDENPSVSWSTPGLHQVDLEIVINCGMDSATVTHYVNIQERPDADFTFMNDVCEDNTVQFTNTGSTGSEYTHEWIFTTDAEPQVSYAENPFVVFETSGLKPVQHIVSNDYCTQIFYDTINIVSGPEVSFSHTGPICVNQTIDFFNTGTTGGGMTYSWVFDPDASPSSSTDENPAGVSFATAGDKTITFTITDSGSGCPNTVVQNIAVVEAPVADFTFVDNPCVGAGIVFSNAGSSGTEYTYLWDFGTSASPQNSTAENPGVVQFDEDGAQTISLTVSNGACSDNTSQVVTVANSPAPDISFSSTAPQCEGESIDFSFDADPTGLDFDWDFGINGSPGTSTDSDPTGITFSTGGVQIITLMVTDQVSGCTNTETQTINIFETPVADFSFTDSVCLGALVDFTNEGASGQDISYAWDFGADATPGSSVIENPTGVEFNTTGDHIITLSVSSPNCVSSYTDTIFIKNSPAPELDFSSTSPVCAESDITFNVLDYDPALDYSWDFGADATPTTANGESPTIIFNTGGVMNVQLYAIDPVTGCDNYTEETVVVYTLPNVSFTSTAPVCDGDNVTFTNTGDSGMEFSYAWDFGADATPAVSSAENPSSVQYSSGGDKEVTFTITSNNCTMTVTQTIEIYDSPVADFTTDAPQCEDIPIQMHNLSEVNGSVTYNWYFDTDASMTSSNDENPIVSYVGTGTHIISLSVYNSTTGCSDSTSGIITIHEVPDADFSSNAPLCPDEPFNFINEGSTGGDFSFTWSFGRYGIPSSSLAENPTGITFSQGGPQDIILTVSNNHCSNSAYQTIDVFESPLADAGPDTTICANRSLLLGTPAIDGLSYFWTPSTYLDDNTAAQPIASPIAEFTNFLLTVTDDITGCTSMDSIRITMLPTAIANAGQDVSICMNGTVQLGVGEIQGQSYLWSPTTGMTDSTISNPDVTLSESTLFTLSVSYYGCDTVTDEVMVNVFDSPVISAGPDQTIVAGEQTYLNATGGVGYTWSPDEFIDNPNIANPLVNPDDTITYVVIGYDVHGCMGTDSVTVYVTEPQFYIPNSFTPNNDGLNDVFYVRGRPLEDFKLQIINRLNQSIFITKNYYEGWDGTVQNYGSECPEGAYIYIITGVNEEGEDVVETGIVNLIR